MKYAVVIQKESGLNYCAHVPDLQTCIATGKSLEEVTKNIQSAIEFHLEGLRRNGLTIPAANTVVEYVQIEAA